jgi:formylglycine-generating enzyme
MNPVARQKLVQLVARFGKDLGEDSRRCEALLRDVCGNQHEREVFVLVAAVKIRATSELAADASGVPVEVLLAKLSARLHNNLGITEDLARWSVESWAVALGKLAGDSKSPVRASIPASDEAHPSAPAAAHGQKAGEMLNQLRAARLPAPHYAALERILTTNEPRFWLGDWEVTSETIGQKAMEALALLEGKVPAIYKALTGQDWLQERAERWRKYWPRVEALGCGTTKVEALPWVMAKPEYLQTCARELGEICVGAADNALSRVWRTEGGWGTAECVVLCAAGRENLLPSAPSKKKTIIINLPPEPAGGLARIREAAERGDADAQYRSGTNGMVLVPGGSFTMGDTLDGDDDAVPVTANVSAFYMDANLVTWSQWQGVYAYAVNHGYGLNAGAGKAANHPVQSVSWYDCVKWCNARSQQAGKTPVYYTDAGLTKVYTNGEVAVYVNWGAKGYRLPTEAEWEKAARGGLSGQRFPWGNSISQTNANYNGDSSGCSYDLGPEGYNSIGSIGGTSPGTSPVGSFAANGYGLCDMAGNVFQWCWDWYGTPYAGGTNPRGVATGSGRVFRGGGWINIAYFCRAAYRFNYFPGGRNDGLGFRSALPSGQ